ncbi:MAG: isoleucine--tRNA ligase [Bacteroidia bacterium]|nr:isoleucine--tRNA ligase [Bacteroidia bacterium]MDW8134685.1 isoleucine--tRNA ligase [Bacteroidia bacterium]
MWRSLGTLRLPEWERQVLERWRKENTFQRTLTRRQKAPLFVFYEGPPSANGKPGIHHVFSRTLKDLVCRYQTMRGYYVPRRAGWDTHGLPVELSVERELGISKADIGTKISIAEYNQACRAAVMRYKAAWDELTERMGYWIELENPYITFEPSYIESVWWLLKQLYTKGLLYKDYTIQPYSPAAGTALSQHELNLPGAYKSVKDPSITVQFRHKQEENLFFLVWTTTPWTLPSNAALAVGAEFFYVEVETFQPYTKAPIRVILAEAALSRYFSPEGQSLPMSPEALDLRTAKLPYRILRRFKGKALVGQEYEPVFKYVHPKGKVWCVIPAEFVKLEEGTGIVHIAPTFGADDLKAAREHGISSIVVQDANGNPTPLVDKEGKFVPQVTDFAGRFVKNYKDDPQYRPVDEDIAAYLRQRGLLFRKEVYEHNYPHCWRTDKPILYYPIEAWFIRTSALREKLISLNRTITWHPSSIGEGRFGNWLENIEDWNLSRSRFWGIPLPIWRTKDRQYERCIGSFAELREAIEEARKAGFMQSNPLDAPAFDPHRPFIDEIILCAPNGEPMYREPDVIDVWFDSGAMPYAQWHYPFANQEVFTRQFPADFIAEGVDQTRGWFYTLHVIAAALFDSVAYKRVLVNGLVLDKDGNKMSKRLGNVVDPFELIEKYGADPTRWYLVSNAPPWENVRFDEQRLAEKVRTFFGTLHNTYEFFALYAQIDGYIPKPLSSFEEYSPIDAWLISETERLTAEVLEAYENYYPTQAARLIEDFVIERLSNWYVRLNRRRFWKGEKDEDKWRAFTVLRHALLRVAQLMAPIAPFYAEILWENLKEKGSVHESDFPLPDLSLRKEELEEAMEKTRRLASLIHSLRKQKGIRVRQPLSQVLVPASYKKWLEPLAHLLLSEVNVKQITYLDDQSEAVIYELRPNYRLLGPKLGTRINELRHHLSSLSQESVLESIQRGAVIWEDKTLFIPEEIEVRAKALAGWLFASETGLTVALDTRITPELEQEGWARELIHHIQNARKANGLSLTERIHLKLYLPHPYQEALTPFSQLIAQETLAEQITWLKEVPSEPSMEFLDSVSLHIEISKAYEHV